MDKVMESDGTVDNNNTCLLQCLAKQPFYYGNMKCFFVCAVYDEFIKLFHEFLSYYVSACKIPMTQDKSLNPTL